ncbi:MAG: hypothetical protein HFG05_12600 [Oscillibacter sp.]|nr:hypothetical protein [Oscillibacter sp.]
MNEFEIAYYLSLQQLLLLLSLIDQRPVVGLPSIETPDNWQRVAMALLQDERFRFENENLLMDKNLAKLLMVMKDAEDIYAIQSKQPGPGTYVMYAGKSPVLLEILPGRRVRLRQTITAEFKELIEALLMPCCPMPEALLTSFPDDKNLKECFARWQTPQISFSDSPSRWNQIKEARGVLEYHTLRIHTRWIWVDDTAAGLMLRQDQNGTRAELDTVSHRKALLKELRLET